MDLGLPGASGIAATAGVRQASPDTRVLVLTAHNDVVYLRRAFAAGAAGYLLKEAADIELVQAVRTVASGQQYLHPTLGAPPHPGRRSLANRGGCRAPSRPRGASYRNANWRCSGESPAATPTPRSPPRFTPRCAPSRPAGPTSSKSSAPVPAPNSSNVHAARICSLMTSLQ